MDQDSYNQLSAIAPTVPQTVGDGWFEPWKTQALTVAQAVSASDQDSVIASMPNVFTGKDLSGAIAFSSPLSLPVVAQQLPPLLTTALR